MAAVQPESALLDTQPELNELTTPSPSSQDAIENPDQKLSRKREREVSLDPSTPKPDADDDVSTPSSGPRSPKKKNRVYLESTKEEDGAASHSRSRSNSRSRPSPPHEVKVRQISQGVEDISWRRKKLADAAAAAQKDDISREPSESLVVEPIGGESVNPTPISNTPPAEVVASTTEASLDHNMDKSQDSIHTNRSSGSDNGDQEKGLKRKLADRATSHGPENGDLHKTTVVEPSKRAKDDVDDNPRAKKRPTPPRTPEQASSAKERRFPTPPVTPPQDSDPLPKGTDLLKRPRDEADADSNIRETKKPSPPPEKKLQRADTEITNTPKLGGFMAYASISSPFASVKGQNIFGGSSKASSFTKGPSPSPSPSPAASFALGSALSSQASQPGDISTSTSTSTSTPTVAKRSGFEAFAGSASPFASASRSKSPSGLGSGSALRSKSPGRRAGSKNTSAFTSYAMGGAQAFAVPQPKRVRAESPEATSSRSSLERTIPTQTANTKTDEDDGHSRRDDGQLSFGEKLRAGKDADEDTSEEETKPELEAQSVQTGEENENTVYQVRAKLYHLSKENQWRERGTGTLKLNIRKSDGEGARIVMRKEAVLTVLLNVALFHGMKVSLSPDPRYVRVSVIESGAAAHYNLRVGSAKVAEELMDTINAYIPSAPA